MGWAGRQIRASRRHVAMPRRWVWLTVAAEDAELVDDDGEHRWEIRRVWVAYSRVADGRAEHGPVMSVKPAELWAVLDYWAPPRGGLWVWTDALVEAPWAVGMDRDLPEAWGWTRGHTMLGDERLQVVWKRRQTTVRLVGVQGAVRGWAPRGRIVIDAIRDDVLDWAAVVEHHGLGYLRGTVGAQAWEAYRARWCDGSLWAGGSEAHVTLAREALVGGIADALRRGELDGTWHVVDMSRCYRAVMRDEYLPLRSVSRLRFPDVSILRRAVERDCVIATVALTRRGYLAAERDAYGMLHWRRGEGLATLTTPDLRDALAEGVVEHVEEMATWTRGRPLRALAEGVEALEASAESVGGTALSGQAKGLANAVYGRLAMRSRKWVRWERAAEGGIRTWSHWSMEARRWERFRQIGTVVEREAAPTEHRWGHVACAAHIAAYGRQRLRLLLSIAGEAHVAHLDTDGLIVDDEGFERLALWDDWERYGLRVDASGECEVRGVRDWTVGDRTVRSGGPRGGG